MYLISYFSDRTYKHEVARVRASRENGRDGKQSRLNLESLRRMTAK